LGIRGPKSKIEENSFVVFVMENRWPKNGLIPSRNKKEAMFVTDRQTESMTKNNRLLG